ncbi:MAG: hypothetical protein JKY53_13005 [Flavobacteriales bacterium]|nr:hypothetical protein [Flavobacteriales bacterium]
MAKAIYLLLLAVLVVALFLSMRWGVAAVSHSLAMNQFKSWQKHTKTPSENSWQWTYDAMQLAVDWDSSNAEYHNDLGRFYEFTAEVVPYTKLAKLVWYEKAVHSIRVATEVNPSWAIAWANLALFKHKAGQMDKEFDVAINQALLLGESLEPVRVIMAEVAVARWSELSLVLRYKMLDNLQSVLRTRQKNHVLNIILNYQMLPYFCLIFDPATQKVVCHQP